MKEIKIVIGANFGDEGKGQMTDYFAAKAMQDGKSCIVVCHNGSAQKGHTVTLDDGRSHIFHHFGAGSLAGADTYFSSEFVLNPIFFRTEYMELMKKGVHPNLYVNPNCRIAIPGDILINQEIETLRGNSRHGSCGYGFFESILRNNESEYKTLFGDVAENKNIYEKLYDITYHYSLRRIKEAGIENPSSYLLGNLFDQKLIGRYIDDLMFMYTHCQLTSDEILRNYDSIIFEGEQGLLLDEDNMEYFPHLTPSHTGIKNPYEILEALDMECDVEVCYVTRTYLTRHGAGRLDGECEKSEINADMIDMTNQPNEYQGSLRYAKLDVEKLFDRVNKDFSLVKTENYKMAIAVMHENEYQLPELNSQKYHSNSPMRNSILAYG